MWGIWGKQFAVLSFFIKEFYKGWRHILFIFPIIMAYLIKLTFEMLNSIEFISKHGFTQSLWYNSKAAIYTGLVAQASRPWTTAFANMCFICINTMRRGNRILLSGCNSLSLTVLATVKSANMQLSYYSWQKINDVHSICRQHV